MIRRQFDAAAKGVPSIDDHAAGWNLFGDHTTLPAAVILGDALERNSAMMADYCHRNGVSLAPHGKTTMSPELFELQIRAGAWAITAAGVHQARVMADAGVPRVLIANEVTAPGDIRWLAERVRSGFEVLCYVDSIVGAQLLHDVMITHAPSSRLGVLVELGVPGGRTGARTVEEALRVAGAVAELQSLHLAGVSGFEGIISGTVDATAEERVDDFLCRLAELAEELIERDLASEAEEFVVSAGGSVFFDRVVTALTGVRSPRPVRVVMRSGCYLTHDDGVIDELSPLGNRHEAFGEVFHAALEVWAAVLSRPETGRIILGAGRRDMSTDGLLPVAKKWVRRGTHEVNELAVRPRVINVDDQHAYIDVDSSWDVCVGDYVGLGISHPCTTFDKWRVIAVVDADYNVVDVVTTRI
jgi:D-serine dehydratase